MDQQEIFAVVKEVISRQLGIDARRIGWSSSLRGLGATTGDLVEIEMTLEEELLNDCIESSVRDARTVGDVVELFSSREPVPLPPENKEPTLLEKVLQALLGP